MQVRRRDALHWGTGNTFLLSGALSLLFIAFVFYDQPITNNAQIFSYLRGDIASIESPKVIPLL